MKGKRIFLASLLIVLFAMLTSLFVVDTYAENSRKVKVGFFPMEGYHIVNKDGSYDVSARSNKGNVDIAHLMYLLNNGGGNFNSASCAPIFIDADSLDKEKEDLYKKIDDIIYHRNTGKKTRYKVIRKKKKDE